MTKKIKKSVSILLALVMLCGVLAVAPVAVGATATTYIVGTAKYSFDHATGNLHLISGKFNRDSWGSNITRANVLSVTADEGVVFTGSCQSMFSSFSNCISIDLRNVDTSTVTTMGFMFFGCTNLEKLDVSKFDTTKVNYMWGMFQGCSTLTKLNVSSFDTRKVIDINHMFCDCSRLTSLDLSNFVITIGSPGLRDKFLSGCSNLKEIKISGNFYAGIGTYNELNNGLNNNGWRIKSDPTATLVSGSGDYAVIAQPSSITTYKWIEYSTVTWKNWDNSTLDTEDYKLEAPSIHPTYNNGTPTRPNSDGKFYTFAGWTDGETEYGINDELPIVTGNIIYTAIFTESSTYTLNYIYQGRKGGNKGGYVGDDGDTDEKTYTVTVELGDSDLELSGMPKAKILVDNAPVVNDPYKDCRWTFTDEYVEFDSENNIVTITAEQPERKYSVVFKDSNNTTTDVFRVKLNEYVKKNDSFITVPETDGSGTPFAYWSVVQNGKEVARCFEKRFNLRVTGDSVVTAHYGEAENLVTLSEAEISRQQFTENGTKKDLLYADFITAYMDKQEMKLSQKTGSEYKTGMIVQYSPDVKVAKENAPGATLSASDKIEFANGDLLSKENAKTIANGGTVGGKYSYLTAPIDNTKYNDKNRLNKSLVFTNTETARRLVLCAYYYVYNVKTDEIEMTAPVYFYLYDAGNAVNTES